MPAPDMKTPAKRRREIKKEYWPRLNLSEDEIKTQMMRGRERIPISLMQVPMPPLFSDRSIDLGE